MEKEKELKLEALKCAVALHCSPNSNGDKKNPADVMATAKEISAWLES